MIALAIFHSETLKKSNKRGRSCIRRACLTQNKLESKNFVSLLYIMAPLITLIALCITYLFPSITKSQSSASCYYYGCGFYGSTQDCQCNRECEDFGDCCSDYNSICKNGNFEECPSAPIIKQDRRENKNRLRFVSFNIEWLFLNYSHSMGGNLCPGNGCDWRNTPDAYKHLETVAQYLDQFDADIIMLQETCDCWTIHQLINIMPVNGQYYRPYLPRGTILHILSHFGVGIQLNLSMSIFCSC